MLALVSVQSLFQFGQILLSDIKCGFSYSAPTTEYPVSPSCI